MGWSSWNSFANTVDSAIATRETDALIASGMKKAGYRYINIDEGWWFGQRDKDGNIVVNPKQWPAIAPGERSGDMSNIVRYIHGHGLKAGIYTDAGETGCGFIWPAIGPPQPRAGSEGHYDQDFLQFAKWGFDYVKVDWCGGNRENLDPAVQYTAISRAIQRAERITGHPLFFSICDWGKNSPWTWAPGVGGAAGDIWRTSGDIVSPIVANTSVSGQSVKFPAVFSNFDHGIHPEAQHTGFYNDPDMMVVGMPGMSETQDRVHMALWAISGAPLLVGADITRLSNSALRILTNPEVIAVDQDSLGLQSVLVAESSPGLQVWTKPLADAGNHAVVLLNRTTAPAQIAVKWREIGLVPSSAAIVRNLFAAKALGTFRSSYSSTVPAGDVVMLTIRGKDEKPTRYEAGSAVNEVGGGAIAVPCTICSGGKTVAIGEKRSLTFEVAPSGGPVYIRIAYINNAKSSRIARLRVNGQIATNILFPPTGEVVGEVILEANLDESAKKNRLTFSSPCAPGPAIESIEISRVETALHPSGKAEAN
ncbi:MAG: alpha-galactosidase D [Acidobacteriaceae bacterium]